VRPFARAYVHAGMVGLSGEKMSKSKGNLIFISELRSAGAEPAAIRLALLARHYRSDWQWTAEDLSRAVARLSAWCAAVAVQSGPPAEPVLAEVRAHLANDLDAPQALAAVDRWAAAALSGSGPDSGPGQLVAATVDALLGVHVVECGPRGAAIRC